MLPANMPSSPSIGKRVAYVAWWDSQQSVLGCPLKESSEQTQKKNEEDLVRNRRAGTEMAVKVLVDEKRGHPLRYLSMRISIYCSYRCFDMVTLDIHHHIQGRCRRPLP